MSNYGKGCFNITPAGNIRYRFKYTDMFGNRRVKSVTGVDEAHCLQRANEFLKSLRTKYDLTIPELLIPDAERDLKMNHIGPQGYRSRMNNIDIISENIIGIIPIPRITARQIDDFLMSVSDYSSSKIRCFYSLLNIAFAEAEALEIVDVNIMKSLEVRCPKSSQTPRKARSFTESEEKRFIKALTEYKSNGHTYRIQMLLELYCGMRIGEINALKPEDINLNKGYICVNRTVSKDLNGEAILSETTKTAAGQRTVPINRFMIPLLEEALREMKENPYGLIFYDSRKDVIISTQRVSSVFNTVCKRAGLKGFRQHCLRHTFATRCIEAGIEPVVLKGWLGHTNIHTTLDTYTDVFDRMELGAIDNLDEYLTEFDED